VDRILDEDELRNRSQWRLQDVAYVVAVLALLFADLAPALRSGKDRDWMETAVVFTVGGMLLSPVLLICAIIRYSPTSLKSERDAIGFLLRTFVVALLLIIAMVIQAV